MTERLQQTPATPARRAGAPTKRRRSRLAERSALRNPLPALAAAITVFLVVLTLMVARLNAGHDPGLGALASAPASVLREGHGRTVLRTTASGRTILTTEGAGGQAGASPTSGGSPLLTRASGGGRRDD